MPQYSNFNGNNNYNGLDRTQEFDPQDIEANKIICGLAYLGILFFLPLVCCPNSRFGKFHANQALVVFIIEVVIGVLSGVFRIIPFFGWMFAFLLGLINVGFFVVSILWIVFTATGTAKEIPVIGKIKLIS